MIKSGDIILFEGRGIISRLIRWVCRDDESHIGQAYRNVKGGLFLYDSTTLSGKDGVKLRLLSEVIENYNGVVKIRPISKPFTELQMVLFRKNIAVNIGKGYEESKLELLLAAIGRFIGIKVQQPSGTLYCSELVASVFRDLGFIDHDKALTPSDFSEGKDKYLELKHITLGKEIILKE